MTKKRGPRAYLPQPASAADSQSSHLGIERVRTARATAVLAASCSNDATGVDSQPVTECGTPVAIGGGMLVREREWDFDGARVCDGNDPGDNVFQLREARVDQAPAAGQ